MKLLTKSLNYSRDTGYFVLEKGASTIEKFKEIELKLANAEHVQIQSGGYDWTDFTFDKFFTNIKEIKEFYKTLK